MYLLVLAGELLAGVIGFLVGRTFGPMKCLYGGEDMTEKSGYTARRLDIEAAPAYLKGDVASVCLNCEIEPENCPNKGCDRYKAAIRASAMRPGRRAKERDR